MSIFIDILIGKRELLQHQHCPITSRLYLSGDDALWTNVLQRFVSPDSGLVDYVGIQQDIDFITVVEVVSRQSPQSHPELLFQKCTS